MQVGQIIVAKEVNEDGTPIEWETKDYTEVTKPTSEDNGKFLGCENGKARWLPVEASDGGGGLSAFEKIDTIDISTMVDQHLGVEYTLTDVTEIVLVWTGMTNTTTSNSSLLLNFNDGNYYYNTLGPRTGKAGKALNGYSYMKVLDGVGMLPIVSSGAVTSINYTIGVSALPYNLIPVKEKIQKLKIIQPGTQYYADAGTVEVYVR